MRSASPIRPPIRAAARAALAALLLASAPGAAAAEEEPAAATFAPSEAPTADVPSYAPPVPTAGRARRNVIVGPHLDVGLLTGGPRLGLGIQAGLRIHTVLLLWSAFVVATDEEYMTFSGVKVGYQHTLSPWWAMYATAGVGSAGFNDGGSVTRRGSAAVFDLGFTVGHERSMNVLSFGAEVLVPSAPAGFVQTVGDTSLMLTLSVNPLLMGGARAVTPM